MKKILTMLGLAVLLLVPLASPLQAADEPNLARMWVVKPKPGMDRELEAALKAHNAWRSENQDPWSWNIYHTTTGADLDLWFIRSPGHSYADFAAYGDSEFTTKAYKHWMDNVDRYVAEYRGEIEEYAPEISQWPENDESFEYFWVYTYHVQPGLSQPFYAAAKAITDALKAAGWNDTYAFTWRLTGDVPALNLVIPEKDWAGFAGPEKDPFETLAEALGEDQAAALWADFYEPVTKVTSTVYHRHADLSIKGAGQ
jgi:hypothetical protein